MSTTATLLIQANRELYEHAQAVPERVANGLPPGGLLEGVAFSYGPLPGHRLYHELLEVGASPAASEIPPGPGIVSGADFETPEPELTRAERKAERKRLGAVRRERRSQSMARAKDRKNHKKDDKKESKGKRR